MEPEPNAPDIEQEPRPSGVISGFWKRAGAFLIDMIIIKMAAAALSSALAGVFGSYFAATTALPFLISLPYFAFTHSRPYGGQSYGMRAMKIAVVDASGQHLSLVDSTRRAAVLCLCTTFPGLLTLLPLELFGIMSALLVLTTFSAITTFYLAAFNRRTRQGLHDLLAGSYVVHCEQKGPVAQRGISKVHFCVLPILYLAAIMAMLLYAGPCKRMLAVMDAVRGVPGASPCGVQSATCYGPSGAVRVLSISMIKENDADPEQIAWATAQAAATQPLAADSDVVNITVMEPGFDIWVASASHVWVASAPVSDWADHGDITLQSSRAYRILFFTLGYRDMD